MDISLLYILLRNVCTIQIQAHNRGWGNTPDSADRSVSANIERLRLARNQCGHSLGGMCYTEFNQIWSEIKAAVVDLDKALGNGKKYQEIVDLIQNDTMDPVRDKHYRDQLHEQMKEIEKVMEEVNNLKKKTEENDQQVKEKIQKLESSQEGVNERMMVMENRNIPPNIKEQHTALLKPWQKDDEPFHEIQNFPNILEKVKMQAITTIIGSPGSGKTAMAHHLSFRLQMEFEIVPVDEISEIKQYGQMTCKQLFILDDVIGVFGVEYEKLTKIEKYKGSIFNVLGERSKILFTCRKAVYNEASNLNSFVLNEEYIVDLEDSINCLNAEDRKQILNNHCKQYDITLRPEELPNFSSTAESIMYPLLCKLFCSIPEYRAIGREFFEHPYICIREKMKDLKGHNKIQYASLVLCMLCENKITESMITENDSRFMAIKERVFRNCRVTGWNTEIMDALDFMINTFTIRTNEGYSLIHDSVYEVLASDYGNKHPEDMLEYMGSRFVANKFSIEDIKDPRDLRIKIDRRYYHAFAARLYLDLKSLESDGRHGTAVNVPFIRDVDYRKRNRHGRFPAEEILLRHYGPDIYNSNFRKIPDATKELMAIKIVISETQKRNQQAFADSQLEHRDKSNKTE
nr:uncharacterized protein LOC111110393 isoform X2 [Crassostrea virginica]XP_022302585.1 uncharacterized protein LOC111110393 isoform X2 [Crassostrea virginica]